MLTQITLLLLYVGEVGAAPPSAPAVASCWLGGRGRGGEPGGGKSWLVSEATAGMVGARILWGRCLDYGAGMTYWPVAEMLRSAAGIRIADPPAEAARLLRGLIEGLPTSDTDVLHTIGASLSAVAGGQPEGLVGPYEAPSVGDDELRWGLLRTFELLGRLQPLVLAYKSV